MNVRLLALALLIPTLTGAALADVGDPQAKTDHPWYPGELAFSNFDRLFATEAAMYKRVTGKDVKTDEDKALAAFLFRNTHYAHGEEGHNDCFGAGFEKAEWNRDYWTGLFSHGFEYFRDATGFLSAFGQNDILRETSRTRPITGRGNNCFGSRKQARAGNHSFIDGALNR